MDFTPIVCCEKIKNSTQQQIFGPLIDSLFVEPEKSKTIDSLSPGNRNVENFEKTNQKQILNPKTNSSNSENIRSSLREELEKENREKALIQSKQFDSSFLEHMAALRNLPMQTIQRQFADPIDSSIPGNVAAYRKNLYYSI